jgi:hypothetical protein
MPPYTSYFSDAQSAINQWNLGIHEAQRVCDIWEDVCTELNTTYADNDALTDDARDFFTKKLTLYDDPSTTNSYDCGDVEISKAEFKKLVDIYRAVLLFRAFSTTNLKQKAQANYKTIWLAIKKRVGLGSAAESLAKKFNDTYSTDEYNHYLHYLVKSRNGPSRSRKPWVFEHKGKTYLRVWHKKT